jgi:hypothetical protein
VKLSVTSAEKRRKKKILGVFSLSERCFFLLHPASVIANEALYLAFLI